MFFDSLVMISNSLKKTPVNLRQRILEAELSILNINLQGIMNPFQPSTKFVSIAISECFTLDSADNVPYRIVVEVVDKKTIIEFQKDPSLYKAEILQCHLHSVNELNDVGDITSIRENILEALERVLFKPNDDFDSKPKYINENKTKKFTDENLVKSTNKDHSMASLGSGTEEEFNLGLGDHDVIKNFHKHLGVDTDLLNNEICQDIVEQNQPSSISGELGILHTDIFPERYKVENDKCTKDDKDTKDTYKFKALPDVIEDYPNKQDVMTDNENIEDIKV